MIILSNDHLETLWNCGGYYDCPKGPDGKRLGPLVTYAGDYEVSGEDFGLPPQRKRFVGDVYANFAKAEIHSAVLAFFARTLAMRLENEIGLANINVFCGAPIGGYSLCTALSLSTGIDGIKAEKKVTKAGTDTVKEESRLVFARHTVSPGQRVVIVEDVCNNFSTTVSLILNIRNAGGIVVGIVCFLNRSMTVDSVYSPGKLTLKDTSQLDLSSLQLPVISLVRKPIPEFKQEDPEVLGDIRAGNLVTNVKAEWPRLMAAMEAHSKK